MMSLPVLCTKPDIYLCNQTFDVTFERRSGRYKALMGIGVFDIVDVTEADDRTSAVVRLRLLRPNNRSRMIDYTVTPSPIIQEEGG